MSSPASSSAALPIAYVVLRILIVLNWLSGAAIFVLLVAMPTRRWIMSALELSPSPEAERLIIALHAIAVLGLVAIALNILSIVIGVIAKSVSTPEHPLDINAGFSINGWLAVLLTFLLARVFAEGALMRGDLDGTVWQAHRRQARRPTPRSADDIV